MARSLSAMTLAGVGACSTIREDVGQPLVVEQAQLAHMQTHHEVLDAFGPPHRLSVTSAGMVFLYEEIDLVEKQVGVNLSSGRFTLLKAVAGRSVAERRLLYVDFDTSGLTQSYRYQQRGDASAQGTALQFVVAVAGPVDDDYLSESPQTHEWGLALLQSELPVALNRAQHLDTGGSGVQQQGSPTIVGQHTLELR
jgi:hypothetical protein